MVALPKDGKMYVFLCAARVWSGSVFVLPIYLTIVVFAIIEARYSLMDLVNKTITDVTTMNTTRTKCGADNCCCSTS